MDTTDLLAKFTRIGARVKVTDRTSRRFRTPAGSLSLDVRSDRSGESFEVASPGGYSPEVAVLDVQSADRHLLLMVRDGGEKHKYLCGHDERHWFVAAVPESAPVGTVRQAKEALKPPEVQVAQSHLGLRAEARNRRKNAAYRRQGEWFFLPVLGFAVDDALVLRNGPLRRGNGGKPHWTEFCYPTGEETVHVCARHPNGATPQQHEKILASNPKARGWNWQVMRRNPGVYVRGTVRHADHKTIALHDWHRVLMNTENQSKALRNVAFLD